MFSSDLPPAAAAQVLAQQLNPCYKNPDGSWHGARRRDDGFMGFAVETGFSFTRDPIEHAYMRRRRDRPVIAGSITAQGAGSKITADIRMEAWMELVYYALIIFALVIAYIFAADGHARQGLIFSACWLALTMLCFGFLQRTTFGGDADRAEILLKNIFPQTASA